MNTVDHQAEKSSSCDVLIQGGGIGGLTLAIALQQNGYRVKLVERMSQLSELGAGIWMAPNAMQVFSRLHFTEKIIEAGWPVKLLRLQDWKSGDLQTTNMSQIARQYGYETIALHRVVLQRLLFERLEAGSIQFCCEVKSAIENSDHVLVNLSDGSPCAVRILVGADGFNSHIRRMAGLVTDKRYSGSSSYRAIGGALHIHPRTIACSDSQFALRCGIGNTAGAQSWPDPGAGSRGRQRHTALGPRIPSSCPS